MQTAQARIQIDGKGFITSIVALKSGREYSPPGHASPLMSLHECGQPDGNLLFPTTADFDKGKQKFTLKYPNGATAVVKAVAKEAYFRFQLVSLTPRDDVDNIVWGPLHTTISGKIGDIIGVVRDDDWAIGMLGLDDNTITGPVTEGDMQPMYYYIHSLDPKKCLVPPKYHEGERFKIGGDGVNDVAFYSHPEEYFQQAYGDGAWLEPEFGSSVAYHSRDRQRSYTYNVSLLPGFNRSRPRHQVTDPLPGVDFTNTAIALYACPDDQGLATIEKITVAEGLPHIVIAGKWVRDPSSFKPQLYWNGPMDKAIEYCEALGLKIISRDTGEFYPSLGNNWKQGRLDFSNGRSMSYQEFTDEAHKHGLSHGGLHTLCVFLQGGICRDVTPVPSEHLQTGCRTKLARDISAADTEIEVTDPSFLAEKGTWPRGDDSNYLRIGGEMFRYDGISAAAPWILKGVKRGHASKAVAHKAGEEVVKLQQNCYNGFVPDMKLMADYADYYADLMFRNSMDCINFDGFESTLYQNQGYYGTRLFCRRLYETYHKLTGKYPRVTGSCVFAGSWEYFDVCNVGGGDNMFNAVSGRRATEGKDIGNGFSSSYFPATFGIQSWHSDWSLYDAENLEAKSIGWDATYAFSVSQAAIDSSGEKDAIFKAFHAWETARELGAFPKALKQRLTDPAFKFHLEQIDEKSFVLYPVKEVLIYESAGNEAKQLLLGNPHDAQPLQFALQVDGIVNGCIVTLPDGSQIKSSQKMQRGQFIICKGAGAYLADHNRKKITDIVFSRAATLPQGESKLGVQFAMEAGTVARFNLTVWIFGKDEKVLVSK
jgi:hypothetical protein